VYILDWQSWKGVKGSLRNVGDILRVILLSIGESDSPFILNLSLCLSRLTPIIGYLEY